jgi:hypothetical protein
MKIVGVNHRSLGSWQAEEEAERIAQEEARRAETLSQKTSKEPTWHTKQAN